MPSKATYLQISNDTNIAFTTHVSQVDSYDWDGVSRPDHNFENVTIWPGANVNQREELNSNANSNQFTLQLVFVNGDQISFRVDQHYALYNTLFDHGVYTLLYSEGAYRVYHKVDGKNGHFLSVTGSAEWMRDIPNGTHITAISIPGTHDSGTKNGSNRGSLIDAFVISQDMSITEQLNSGIRFIDIRCQNNADNFGVQHGIYDIQNTTFNSVLKECVDFLNAHPTEILLLCLKKEDSDINSKLGFTGAFEAQYVDNYPWYKGSDLPVFSDETRGKIVLVNRFDDNFTKFGFQLDVNDDTYTRDKSYSNIKYNVQDLYKLDSACDNKVDQVVGFANEAATVGDKNAFYLNFASGYNIPADSLHDTSVRVNPRVELHLPEKGRFGVIAMDFAPRSLIIKLIRSNF